MHRSSFPMVCIAIAVAWLGAGCAPPKVAPLPSGSTVVALGDSLTWGTGATPETSYPSHLTQVSGWNVINAGVPGDTAQQGCDRLHELLAEHQPELVLVFLGGNDILRRYRATNLTDGLWTCVRAAGNAGVPMQLLAAPTFGLTGFADAPLFADFANNAGVPLLHPELGALLRNDALRADAIHLNGDGYRALAANIATELRRLEYLAP